MPHRTSATSTGNSRRSPLTMVLRYCVPVVISVGLCWLLLRGMDVGEMWRTIRSECDFRWLLIDVLCLIGAQVARAARWRLQLDALGIKASLWVLTLSVFGTYAVNLVFPRLGEVWRTGFVADRQRAPFSTVFGSMIADRLADTIAVGLITLATLLIAAPQLTGFLHDNGAGKLAALAAMITSPYLWVVIALLAAAVTACMMLFPRNRGVILVKKIWNGLWKGFAVITHMQGKGTWLAYTVVLWMCYFVGLGSIFMSFPLTATVLARYGVSALLVCFVMTSLSMIVPSNGGIGPWQWAMIFALGFYCAGIPGLDRNYMATFANLALGVQTISSIILGLFTFGWIALNKSPRHHEMD